MPAQITPFTEGGEIDLDAFAHNVAVQTERGLEGFLVGGSTGEGPYLEQGERAALCRAVREADGGDDIFVMCGLAGESLRQTQDQVDEAAAGGADAVLVLSPTSLVRGNDGAIAGFYEHVAAASPLPVYLYSVPRWTGYDLPADTAKTLANDANVGGMKDSGGHPVKLLEIARGVNPDHFKLFNGSSPAVALSIAAGAYGAITASANYAPSLVREVVNAARKGSKKAAEAQEQLTGLSRLAESRGIPGVKIAAEVAGLQPGLPRMPLSPLADDEGEQLRRSIAALRHQLLG